MNGKELNTPMLSEASPPVIEENSMSPQTEENTDFIFASDDEKEYKEDILPKTADESARMVGTIHQHHACKLCGHLRRGHICTNPNGKESRLPAVVGICNNSDVIQISDSLSLKAFKIIKNFSAGHSPISYSDIYNRINQNHVENDIIRKSFAAKLMKCLSFLTARGDVVATELPLPSSVPTLDEQYTFEVLVPARLNTNGIAKSEHLKKAYHVSPNAKPRELISENFLMKKRKKYPEIPFIRGTNDSSVTKVGFFDSAGGDMKDKGRDSKDKEDIQSGRAGRAVEQFDLETGRLLRRYASMQEASVAMGQKPHYIAYHVFGKGATFSKSVFGWREVALPPNPRVLKAGGLTTNSGAKYAMSPEEIVKGDNSHEVVSHNILLPSDAATIIGASSSLRQDLSGDASTVNLNDKKTVVSGLEGEDVSEHHGTEFSVPPLPVQSVNPLLTPSAALSKPISIALSTAGVTSSPTSSCTYPSPFNSCIDSNLTVDNVESEIDQAERKTSHCLDQIHPSAVGIDTAVHPSDYEDIGLLRKYMDRYMHRTAGTVPSWSSFIAKVNANCLSDHDSDDNLELLKLKRMKSMGRVKDKKKDKQKSHIKISTCVAPHDEYSHPCKVAYMMKSKGSSSREMSSSKWKKQQIEHEIKSECKLVAASNTQGKKVLQQIDPQTGIVLRTYKSGQEASKAMGRQANYISYYIFGIGSRLHKSVFLWRRSWQLQDVEERAAADLDALKMYMDRYTNKNRVPSWTSFLEKYESDELSDVEEEVEAGYAIAEMSSGWRQRFSSQSSSQLANMSPCVDEVLSKQARYEEISKLMMESLRRLEKQHILAFTDTILREMSNIQSEHVSPQCQHYESAPDMSKILFSKKMVLKCLQKCLKRGEITLKLHPPEEVPSPADAADPVSYSLNPLYKQHINGDTPSILCMDITRHKSLFVFSNIQEVSQTLRIPAKAIHAVCQGRVRSTHGISFRWFHPDSEPHPEHLVSASSVRRDFMKSKAKEREEYVGRGLSDGEEDDKVDNEEGIANTKLVRAGFAASKKKSKQSKSKNERFNIEENLNLRGKANVPIRKTAMISVSSRTGRARKLTYKVDYCYEGSGLGVDDTTLVQTQVCNGELQAVTKKRKREMMDVYVPRKSDKYTAIECCAGTLNDLLVSPDCPETELSTLRSFIGSTFTSMKTKSPSQCAKSGKNTRQGSHDFFKVTALCTNHEFPSVLFFKYYSLRKYPHQCPPHEYQYEFSDSVEMTSHQSWVQWTTAEEADGSEEDELEQNDESNGDESSSHESNIEGELKRPKARTVFAARVFEAVQSFESELFSPEQILQKMVSLFSFKYIPRITLSQGIRRCVYLGQLIEHKNNSSTKCPEESCGQLSSDMTTKHQPLPNFRSELSPHACMYSINPLFKGLDYESAVLCTSLDGVFIQIFSSVAETSDCFQIEEEFVRKLCHGIGTKTLGISLRYASDVELQAATKYRMTRIQEQMKNQRSTVVESADVDPCLWSIDDAWKFFKPETKSQSRKRLQKEVHECVEKLHAQNVPMDAFAIYRRIFQHFVGKGIHPVHVEEILQLLTTKGFFTVDLDEDVVSAGEEEHKKFKVKEHKEDLKGAPWELMDARAKAGVVDGWPRYTLSPGYKRDFDTAAVVVLSADDEPLKMFSSMYDATLIDKFALDKRAILRVLFRKQSSHKGLRFKWADSLNAYEKEELAEQVDEEVMQRLEYLTNPSTCGGRNDAGKLVSARKSNRISIFSSKLSGIYEVDDVHHSRKRLQSLLRTENDQAAFSKKQKIKKLAGHNFDNYFPVSVRAYCARHEVDVYNFHAKVEEYKPLYKSEIICDGAACDQHLPSMVSDFRCCCHAPPMDSLVFSADRSHCPATFCYNCATVVAHDNTTSLDPRSSSICGCQDLKVFLDYCRYRSYRVGSIIKVKIPYISVLKENVTDDIDSSNEDSNGGSDLNLEEDHGAGCGDDYVDQYENELVVEDHLSIVTCSSKVENAISSRFVVKTACLVSGRSQEGNFTVFDGNSIHEVKMEDIIVSPWQEEQDNLIDKWYAHHHGIPSRSCNNATGVMSECCLIRDWESRLDVLQEQQWTESEIGFLISAISSRHRKGPPNMRHVHRLLMSKASNPTPYSRSIKDTLRTYFSYFSIKNSHQKYASVKAVFRCAERLLQKQKHHSNLHLSTSSELDGECKYDKIKAR